MKDNTVGEQPVAPTPPPTTISGRGWLNFTIDESVPPGEVHAVQNGTVVAKIVGLDTALTGQASTEGIQKGPIVTADVSSPLPGLDSERANALLKDGIPRRCRSDLYSKAEEAIQRAVDICEATLPSDPLETDAVILLGTAREKVADLVDREIAAGRMPMPQRFPTHG